MRRDSSHEVRSRSKLDLGAVDPQCGLALTKEQRRRSNRSSAGHTTRCVICPRVLSRATPLNDKSIETDLLGHLGFCLLSSTYTMRLPHILRGCAPCAGKCLGIWESSCCYGFMRLYLHFVLPFAHIAAVISVRVRPSLMDGRPDRVVVVEAGAGEGCVPMLMHAIVI